MSSIVAKKIILIAAGGTGGHISPALSVIDKIKTYDFIVITDQRGEIYFSKFLGNNPINFKIFNHKMSSPSNKTPLKKIRSIFQFSISLFKSFILILLRLNRCIGATFSSEWIWWNVLLILLNQEWIRAL